MDWCRTWSIHPFIKTAPATAANGTSTTSSSHRQTVSVDSSTTEELDHDATLHFRRYGCMKHGRKRCRSSGENDPGDFVRTSWIPPHRRGDTTTTQHLYVEVWTRGAISAAVTFCYWNDRSCEFCLARGLRSSYEAMFGWIATISDGHVGMVPLCPQSSDLANVVAAWISTEYSQQHSDRGNSSKNIGLANGVVKPMTLTFTTPRLIAEAGLDTISLTVPPQALWKLYNSLCHCERATKHSSDSNQDIRPVEPESFPPIVRAMHCYILETFAIDITTFPLTKIVTSSATLGSDGRYKPSEGSSHCCPKSLFAIRQLVNANDTK